MKHEFSPDYFINRELSWLEFNARVLEEAQDESTPLFERVKFLSIFSSNFDEFFMVRVAGLREQAFGAGAPQDYAADQLSPLEQLQRIAARSRELVRDQYRCWNKSIVPRLAEEGIELVRHDQLKRSELKALDHFFSQRAFPILTPMAVDPSHPRPQYHNRALYVAAILRRRSGLGPRELFAVVQLPKVLPRLVPVRADQAHRFILIEDAVVARLPELFGGFDVVTSTTFRISRDSDIELLEQEADDMMRLIEQRIKARERGQAVRVEVSNDTSDELLQLIVEAEDIREGVSGDDGVPPYGEVYRIKGPIDMTAMNELLGLPGRDQLRDPSFTPRAEGWGKLAHHDPFQAISQRDILLHHPYESFDPVVEFISRAANDPRVLAIKQTLYRTSGDSPVVKALMTAAENGKQVTALVELKARFDEANNVSWARQLEKAGVHVVFGFLDLKTHCKVSLVVRQENDGLRRYVHLGTGNYNPATAVSYTDLGLFTINDDVAADVTALFNLLTGYSQGHQWHKLVVAPDDLHRRTVEMINQQAELAAAGKPSWIFAKMNALVDHRVIAALYRASQAGVPVDLLIRGICSLRPGLKGISENIRVHSIVDRFLEHSRIYAFGPQPATDVFLASADWMPRNFYRRVEVMFPVEAPQLRRRIIEEIIPAYLSDNVKTRVLGPDGVYHRIQPAPGEPRHRVQAELLDPMRAALPPDHSGNGAARPTSEPEPAKS
ncbi:MAG: polyphosphate kinase 1 [Pirellulales bacterium]